MGEFKYKLFNTLLSLWYYYPQLTIGQLIKLVGGDNVMNDEELEQEASQLLQQHKNQGEL